MFSFPTTHGVDEDISDLSVRVPLLHALSQLPQEVLVDGADLRDLVEDVLDQGRVHQSRGLRASQGVIVHLERQERGEHFKMQIMKFRTQPPSPGGANASYVTRHGEITEGNMLRPPLSEAKCLFIQHVPPFSYYF